MRSVELSTVQWRKSSYSNQDGGECLEFTPALLPVVPVRDSKTPHGPVLVVDAKAWASFTEAVKQGAVG